MDFDRDVKLIITYDPIAERREDYFRYVLAEFVPALERLGLKMREVWHTAYGDYPLRLLAFTAENGSDIAEILADPEFHALEHRLFAFVENYERRLVPVRQRFQF